MKIEKLTPQQTDDMAVSRDAWLKHGLSTAPINRDAAKVAVCQMYECAGLAPPEFFIFLDNPHQGAMGAALLAGTKMAAQVAAQVRAQVGDQVWDQVGDQVRDQVRDQVGDQVYRAVFGGHEAAWASFYDFFARHFGLAQKSVGLLAVVKECGWVWPFGQCAIITDRPSVISLDERNRLHCESGPAIEYRDGFAVHAWHGQRIPAEWLQGQLDAKTALSQENTSLRVAAMEILGWPKIIGELGGKVINKHPEGLLGGELLAIPKKAISPGTKGTMKFLRAECPRNGIIAFRVPDEITTAHEAQAWKAGLPKGIYKLPTIRT